MTSSSVVLPRSALLSAWGTAALRGELTDDRALRAVQGDDEPHDVVLADAPALPPCGDLGGLLGALRAGGATGLRLVLPVPGDLSGLAGPAEVNVEALDAAECLLTVNGPPLALVPLVEEFGSVHERGHLVTWWVHDAAPPAPVASSPSDVERQLRQALGQAAHRLSELGLGDSGLARRDPDLTERLTDLRYGAGASVAMPEGLPPRSLRTLDLAWRVRGIVELAAEDDGGAVSGWESSRRSDTLRMLDNVSRHAVVAALNAYADDPSVVRAPQRRTLS